MTCNQAKTELINKNKILFLFVVSVALFLMLAVWGILAFILDPQYRASSQLLVGESAPANSHQEVEYGRVDPQVIEAYASFATSSKILEIVKGELNLHSSITNLRQTIKVEYADNSPVLTVTVNAKDSQQAAIIANTLSTVFQNEVQAVLKVDHVRIISQATSEDIDASPSQQKLMLNLSLAAISGVISSVLILFIVRAKKGFTATRDSRKKEIQMQTVFK